MPKQETANNKYNSDNMPKQEAANNNNEDNMPKQEVPNNIIIMIICQNKRQQIII